MPRRARNCGIHAGLCGHNPERNYEEHLIFGKGKVFIGYNGSDTGVRGSVVAFDANTGKIAWRFWNVPGDPSKGFENKAMEMAAKTWSGDGWWKVGGADVWDPITYDPATGYVIYGTAGATPRQFVW